MLFALLIIVGRILNVQQPDMRKKTAVCPPGGGWWGSRLTAVELTPEQRR